MFLYNRKLWDSSRFFPKSEGSLTVSATVFGWLIVVNHNGANLVDCTKIYKGRRFGLSIIYRLTNQNIKQLGDKYPIWKRFWFINWQVRK